MVSVAEQTEKMFYNPQLDKTGKMAAEGVPASRVIALTLFCALAAYSAMVTTVFAL